MGTTEPSIRPAHAARFSGAVMLVAVGLAAVVSGTFALSRGATPEEVWTLVLGGYPGQAAVAGVVGAGTLTLLLMLSPPAGRWGLGWRGAVAGYAGLIAGALSLLLVAEWIPGEPGAAGGGAAVVAAILAFTLAGGPLWIGLIAALLGRTALLPSGIGKQPLSASQRSRFGTVLIMAGLGAAALVFVGAYVVASHGGLDYACYVEGPFSPLAEVSERPDVVSGSFSWWPLGRNCTWAAADGAGTVLAVSGWGNTVVFAAMLGFTAVGIGLCTTRARA